MWQSWLVITWSRQNVNYPSPSDYFQRNNLKTPSLTIDDKISWDTSPKRGFLTLYWLPGGEIKLLLPHPLHAMLYCCSSYLLKTTNTTTLNEGEWGGGSGCAFFCCLWLPYLSTKVSTILSPIVASFLEMSFLPKIVAVWLKSSPKSNF